MVARKSNTKVLYFALLLVVIASAVALTKTRTVNPLAVAYSLSFLGAIAIAGIAKHTILAAVYNAYKREQIALFAGRNTWLLIESAHEAIVQAITTTLIFLLVARLGAGMTPMLLVVLATPAVIVNIRNYAANMRAGSPRPAVYLTCGILADAIGLGVGWLSVAALH